MIASYEADLARMAQAAAESERLLPLREVANLDQADAQIRDFFDARGVALSNPPLRRAVAATAQLIALLTEGGCSTQSSINTMLMIVGRAVREERF